MPGHGSYSGDPTTVLRRTLVDAGILSAYPDVPDTRDGRKETCGHER